jgi:hypothetical protein
MREEPTMTTYRFRALLAAVLAGLLLAACGGDGGDDDDDDGGNTPPASARRSSDGFIAYIASLADGMFDAAEPIDLERFTAPPDDAENQEPKPTPVDG